MIIRLANRFLPCVIILCGITCYPLDPDRIKSPYYQKGRFYNIADDTELSKKGLWDIVKWKFFLKKKPPLSDAYKADDLPKITQRVPRDLLAKSKEIRIVWLGHSTVWIATQHKGQRIHIITDPIFEGIHQAHERLIPLPIPIKELLSIPIHAVLVSHAHRDHLDFKSLRKIEKHNPKVRIFLPDGTRVFAKEEGLQNIEIIKWWQNVDVKHANIHFTPAHHWSRMGFFDFMQSHWGSYVIELLGKRIYFGGDSGYSIHFKEIAKHYPKGFDIALLPIGAFRPRGLMKGVHIDPLEAIQVAQDLRARLLLPIHWGTFRLGHDLPLEAITYLRELLAQPKQTQKTIYWNPGEVYSLAY